MVMPPTTRREHPWLFALLMPAAAVAAGMGVQLVAWQAHGYFRDTLHHVATLGALVLLAARAPVDAAARALLGPRGPVVAWCAAAVGAVALALYEAMNLDHFLRASWSFLTYFGALWELEPEAVVVPVALLIAGASLPHVAVPSRRRLWSAAALATALAGALLAAASVRAARAPEVHRYVRSLPVVGEIPALNRPLATRSGHDADASNERAVYRFGELSVARYVFDARGQCQLALATRDAPLPPQVVPAYSDTRPCDEATVRLDRARGVYVVTRGGSYPEHRAYDRETLRSYALDGLGASPVRAAFSLPRAWRDECALLLAIALAALVFPLRARARLARRGAWRQGLLGDDGVIALDDDGARCALPYGTMLAPGPVVLLDGAPTREGDTPFRDAAVVPTPERGAVVQGTLSDVVASLDAAVDARAAYALAAALLAAAPWAAAALLGLVP